MLLPKFEYHEPATLEEACQIMSELGQQAKPIAGGTDLIVNMKKKILTPGHLVSLSRIDDLKKLGSSKGLIKLGACLTAAELAESQEIRNTLNALNFRHCVNFFKFNITPTTCNVRLNNIIASL